MIILKTVKFKYLSILFPLVLGFVSWTGVERSGDLSRTGMSSENELCSPSHRSFVDREKVTYKVYYNWNFVWIPAGEATFTVSESDDEYYFKAEGTSYPSYDWFFKVHDIYESKVRKSDLKPIWTKRQVAEGRYRLYHEHYIDHESGTARSIKGKTAEDASEKTVDVGDCFQDILSSIYFLRNSGIHTMDKGEKLPVNLFIDDTTYQVNVEYLGGDGRKKIKGLGKVKVQRITPDLLTGSVFRAEDEMNVWVSHDENRLPVMVESPIIVGSVKVFITDYENLIQPLDLK
jgi:hypothetical protein